MRIEICTRTNTVRIFNKFDETKHPRDNDGKFAHANTITVRGNELAGFGVSGTELRMAAVDYYKKHLAGTTVKHPELGEIIFSQSGYKKPISFSADERKLRLFPSLPDIIKQGNVIATEKDRYNRTQVQDWVVVESIVVLDTKPIKVRVNLRKDASGRLYYDHVISKNPSGTAYNDSQSRVLNSSIKENRTVVNLLFV